MELIDYKDRLEAWQIKDLTLIDQIQKRITDKVMDYFEVNDVRFKNITAFETLGSSSEAKPGLVLKDFEISFPQKYTVDMFEASFVIEGYGISKLHWSGLVRSLMEDRTHCYSWERIRVDMKLQEEPEQLSIAYITILSPS